METLSKDVVVLGYWNFRGLANPIRALLEHAGQKYESKVPETREAWFEGKASIGLPFPNLPYLIDGNTKLTQSRAILRYLARKHCFVAKTEEETQKQDMVDGVLSDIGTNWFQLVYLSKDIDRAKQEYAKDRMEKFRELDHWLSKHRFLTGDDLNYTDFLLFETLNNHNACMPDLLEPFVNLQRFHKEVMSQAGVKEFVTSERNPSAICSPLATWKAGTV